MSEKIRVHLGTDHAGFSAKENLAEYLRAKGVTVVDHGAKDFDPEDDYPGFCIAAAEAVRNEREAGQNAVGVVLGGSGNGEQIAANKVSGIRAALSWNPEISRLARAHNNAHVVAVGARQHSQEDLNAIVAAFIDEPFSAETRHQRRIDAISDYEKR